MKQILPLIYCFGFIWSIDVFCKKHFEYSKTRERIFVSVLFLGCFFIMKFQEFSDVPYVVATLLFHVLFVVFLLFMFRGQMWKKILIAVLLIGVKELVGNFSESFFCCLVLIGKHAIWHNPGTMIGTWGEYGILCIKYTAIISVIVILSGRLQMVLSGKGKNWYMMLAIPLMLIILLLDIVNHGASNGILVRSEKSWDLYHNQLFSHTAICILTALSMCAAGFYIFGMNKIYMEQRKKEQFFSQVSFYKMLEKQYTQMERLRHDMKNHIIALQGLLKNKEYKKIEQYLNAMNDVGALGAYEDITGNRVVDALLYEKRKQAEIKHIMWECSVETPKTCPVDEIDLCILFGNILDNAIEECGKLEKNADRFITIQGKMQKKFFVLEVKNSTGKKQLHKRELSPKNILQGHHGIGLLNIRDTVEKYNGVVQIQIENSMFIISILLPPKTSVYDRKQTV